MNLLITGGAGFIGTNACLFFKHQSFNVTALDNFSRSGSQDRASLLQKAHIPVLEHDLTHPFPKNFPQFDAIIHLAGNGSTPWSITYPYPDFLSTALATLHLLEFARLSKTPVIYSSTCKVYSSELNLLPTIEKPLRYLWRFSKFQLAHLRPAVIAGVSPHGVNENFPIDSAGAFPHSPYGVSHATADLYCQEYWHLYQVPTVVNRLSAVYGPSQAGTANQGWVDWVVSSKLHKAPLRLVTNGKTVRDLLWVDDLAALFSLQLKNLHLVQGQVFNIGGGPQNSLSIREAASYLDNHLGGKTKFLFDPPRPADHQIYISDIRKIQTILPWKPTVSLRQGIELLVEQYQSASRFLK